MGKITTHVLDTASGRPAAGVRIRLYRTGNDMALTDVITNGDGRCDRPLIQDKDLATGRYRIDFHVGDYFANSGIETDDIPFLDVVPVEFGIADSTESCHIPLLISPYGYSSYRGS